MIVALLILIVLILLFGAGVVKGWIANTVTFVGGGLLVLAVLMWLASFFGENGFRYLVYGILGILGLLAIIRIAVGSPSSPPPLHRPDPPKPDESVRKAMELDRKLAEEFRAKIEAAREKDEL